MREYYILAKPGIVYGNALPAIAGFLCAARGQVAVRGLLATVLGLGLIIASACVWNNIIDRRIDAAMVRTRQRAMVQARISRGMAAVYGAALGLAGGLLLWRGSTMLALMLAIAGWVLYVAVYGLAKRRGTYGTLVGSVPGALPPVIGYVAVTGRIDMVAGALFAVLVAWQMPHFYAIAMFRADDYRAAQLPVVPVVRGLAIARRRSIRYIVLFTVICLWLALVIDVGWWHTVLCGAVGGYWLWQAVLAGRTLPDTRWAKKVFRVSLLSLLAISTLIGASGWLRP